MPKSKTATSEHRERTPELVKQSGSSNRHDLLLSHVVVDGRSAHRFSLGSIPKATKKPSVENRLLNSLSPFLALSTSETLNALSHRPKLGC